MKFLPIAILVLASMVEAKPSFAARDGALRKLADEDGEEEQEQQEEQGEEEQGEEEQGEEEQGEEAGEYAGQVDYSSGYYTGRDQNADNYWSSTSAWYSQYQEADDGEEETQSNSLQFEGCHTFTTSSNNYYANEDLNAYYYGDGVSDGSNAGYSSTKSYVVMTAPYQKQSSNNQGNNDGNNEGNNEGNNAGYSARSDLMEVAIPLTEYMAMLVSGKETERENLCTECSNLVSYCITIETSLMEVAGSTTSATNQNQVIYWDQPWNYNLSDEENMGAYYGVPGAISCNACMANSCYADNTMVSYMAIGVYGYEDSDAFFEDKFGRSAEEQAEYIEEMAEAMETFSACSEIDDTGYYSGWTCTSNGNGIQLAVFSDDECVNYVRGVSYFDTAAEEDSEKFTAVMDVLSVQTGLTNGVSCADKTWTTGSNIAYGESEEYQANYNYNYQNQDQSNANQYQNNGYMNIDYMNDGCANVVQNLIEGEIDLSVCESENQNQNQDENQGERRHAQELEYEMDLSALEGGDYSNFCQLVNQTFGTAQGNQQMNDDWQSAFDNSAEDISYTEQIKQKLDSMDAREIALWSVLAIAGAATLIAAIAMMFMGCSDSDDEVDKVFDDNAPQAPQGEYTLA
jgi:hypothetical protein